jgi:response regulator of citrate/malate metabolism
VIRVLVVEDDFMVAEVHRAYVEKVDGFEVVGEAHSGRQAMEQVERLRPHLLLLDVYLPDVSGLEVLRQLRARSAPVDVLMITAARDADTVRAALQGGALQYLVKPFHAAALRQRLEQYRSLHSQMKALGAADQAAVDAIYGTMRAGGHPALPKGLSPVTLELVRRTVAGASDGLSATEVAERSGVARVTARRYLDHLCAAGVVDLRPRYGSGRPEHRYRPRSPGT